MKSFKDVSHHESANFPANIFVTDSFKFSGRPHLAAKVLASSLMRSQFSGSLMMFHNSSSAFFKVERLKVNEIFVNIDSQEHQEKYGDDASLAFLFNLGKWIRPEPRQWVIVANAAGLVLRNIDQFIPPDFPGPYGAHEIEFYWARNQDERCGECDSASASTGIWAVRGEHLPLVLDQVLKALSVTPRTKSAEHIWTDVIRDLPLRKSRFEMGEVYAPRIDSVNWDVLKDAAFVTVPDWPEKDQWRFLQAVYFGTYFGDETGLMLNILDP